MESSEGVSVGWVASNCGCGDPIEQERLFLAADRSYFEMPSISDYRSEKRLRRTIRLMARHAMDNVRARRFANHTPDGTDVVHFQQTLSAYGSDVLFRWLKVERSALKAVTVHELDNDQLTDVGQNANYNLAHVIFVHDHDLRDKMIGLGVDAHRIHIICHGARLPSARPEPMERRRNIVFYGGHKLMRGKGIETVMSAYSMLRAEWGPNSPNLLIHGHYATTAPRAAVDMAEAYGIGAGVIWLNQIDMDAMEDLYAKSSLCILPFTGSFAGLPCATAAANGLPVIGTRKAGIPEHLGENFVAVEGDNAEGLFRAMLSLLKDPHQWQGLSEAAYSHAQAALDWNVIGGQTLDAYRLAAHKI